MRAGKLRHLLEIQKIVEAQSLSGETTKGWETVATVWGSINPMQARDRFTAQQVQAEVTHTITMRYIDIQPNWRIKFGTRIFQLEAPMNRDERGVELTFLAKEEVG